MTIEIVDFPSYKMVIFHCYVTVHQRVTNVVFFFIPLYCIPLTFVVMNGCLKCWTYLDTKNTLPCIDPDTCGLRVAAFRAAFIDLYLPFSLQRCNVRWVGLFLSSARSILFSGQLSGHQGWFAISIYTCTLW